MKTPRFDTSKIGSEAAQLAPDFCDPAAANLCREWLDTIAKLGYTAVCVQVTWSNDILTFAGPGFEQILGNELTIAGLGHFDSMERGNPFNLFFYLHTKQISEALEFVRSRLEALKILPLCKIAFADLETGVWRSFYPAPKAGKS